MASTAQLKIVVDAATEGAKSGLKGLQDQLKGMGKGGKIAAIGLGAAAAGGVVLAGAAVAGGIAIAKMTMDAAKVENTRVTFGRLAEDIGTTAGAMTGDLREATRGMVSDAKLWETSNKLVTMGLATTSEGAANLMEMGSQLGIAMGRDAVGAMDDFGLMLANSSIPRLDTFGISASKVRERMAELTGGTDAAFASEEELNRERTQTTDKIGELEGKLKLATLQQDEFNKTTKDSTKLAKEMQIDKLNDELDSMRKYEEELEGATVDTNAALDRQSAFMQAVGEIGGEAMKRVGEQGEGAMANVQRMNATWENTKLIIGTAFLPALETVSGAIDNLLTENQPQIEAFAQTMADGVVGWIDNTLPVLQTQLGEMGADIGNAWDTIVAEYKQAEDDMAWAGEQIAAGWENLKAGAVQLGADIAAAFASIGPAVAGAWESVKAGAAQAWASVVVAVNGAIAAIKARVATIGAGIAAAWAGFRAAASSAWASVVAAVTGAIAAIKGRMATISAGASAAWAGLQAAAAGAWASVVAAVTGAIATINGVVTSGMAAVKAGFTAAMSTLRGVVTSAMSAVKSAFSSGINAAKSAVSSGMNAIKSAFSSGLNAAKSIVSGAMSTIRSVVSSAMGTVRSVIAAATGVVRGLGSAFSAVASAISNAVGRIVAAARRAADALKNIKLPGFLTGKSPSPFENTLVSIAGLMREMSQTTIPEFNAALNADRGGDVYNYSLTVHSSASTEQVAADFMMLEALAGA